jgi:hypothetical protein
VIKKHKRRISGGMRRTSRVYLNDLNGGKVERLREFLLLYLRVLAYFNESLWTTRALDKNLLDQAETERAVTRFGITARLAQCAAKQAKETVRSQIKREKKRMPRIQRAVANLDCRFVTIEAFKQAGFDLALRFGSGVPALTVPLNWTEHTNDLRARGFILGGSIRLGLTASRLWVDLIFEKPRPPKRTEGGTLGVDRGFRKVLACSDGQTIGTELLEEQPDFLEPLRGKDLMCWCGPDRPCHADLLLKMANR